MRAAPLAVTVALTVVAGAGTARANGRYPLAGQLALSPSHAGLLELRATFGILLSQDGGQEWSWICEAAVGYSDIVQDPAIGLTASAALVGMFEGLAVSPDDGCSWIRKLQTPVSDLVVRRDDPHSAYALTSSYQGADDAGSLFFSSAVFATQDDGSTWKTFGGPLDPLVVPETIDISGDGASVYVSGYTFSAAKVRQGVVLRSTDGGMHYARSTFDLGATEIAAYIAAIDPGNALRVYLRVASTVQDTGPYDAGSLPDRLLVSDDGGQSFRTVLTSAGPLLGFALSPDGSKVYTGGPVDGVQMADSATLQFQKKSALPVQCLASNGATLFACSDDAVAFFLGESTDDGATFDPLLRRRCVQGALACPADSEGAQCGALFDGLSALQVGTGGADCPGATDAGPNAVSGDAATPHESGGSSANSRRSSSCDCWAAQGDDPSGGPWLLTAAAFCALRARRAGGRATVSN